MSASRSPKAKATCGISRTAAANPDVAAALRPAGAGIGSSGLRARRGWSVLAFLATRLPGLRIGFTALILADRLAVGLPLLILARILMALVLVREAAHARLLQ